MVSRSFYGPSQGPLGGKFDPRNALVQELIREGISTAPVQSTTEGIARALTAGLGGYMAHQMGEKQDAREAKFGTDMAEVLRGGQAKQWVNPDTQTPRIQREDGSWADTAQAGGTAGMIAALSRVDNPDLAQFGTQIAMSDIQATQQRESADLAHRRAMDLKAAPGWEKTPTPKTVTTAEGVFVQNPDGSLGKRLGAPASQAGQGNGPFSGNAMDAQVANILLTGDPSSPSYLAAYNMMAAPKQSYDPATGTVTTIRPDMSAYHVPTSMNGRGTADPAATGPHPDYTGRTGTHTVPRQTSDMPPPVPSAGGGVTVEELPGAPRKFTADQQKSAGFARRMAEAETNMQRVTEGSPDYNPANAKDNILGSAPMVGNYVRSTESQLYRQAQENWVRANLRLESGAVIGTEEMDREVQNYFPQPGDGPEVIEQKRRNRETAKRNLVDQSSGAFDANNPKPAIDPQQAISEARSAIARGAPRDAVIKRLRDNRIDPAGL